MTFDRHQLNLKPEHYVIYIQIKEKKDKTVKQAIPTESNDEIRTLVHNWCPNSHTIRSLCEDLGLNDELLFHKPGLMPQHEHLAGLRFFCSTSPKYNLIKQKGKKNDSDTLHKS